MSEKAQTPWQKVFGQFKMSQRQFANEVGCNHAHVSRKLADDVGTINGRDQALIMTAAKRLGIKVKPEDIVPFVS